MFLEEIASCFAIDCITLLVILYILVIGFILILFIIFHKCIFDYITDTSEKCKKFIEDNSGFFTMFFLFVFFFEQLLLVIGVLFFDVSVKLQAFIGVFALIVITTATIQKFVWEYKYVGAKSRLGFIEEDIKKDLVKLKSIIKLKNR